MIRRRLGRTTLQVSEIGLGCQSLGGGLFHRNDREAVRVLHRALEAGINFFDTADHYSLGRSEALIGAAFKGRRGEVVIATKIGTTYSKLATAALRARSIARPFSRMLRGLKRPLHNLRAAQRRCDFSRAYLERATGQSLRRLRTDTIDLLMLHKPPAEVFEHGEAFETLERLVRAGKIRHYGVSCDGAAQALAALRVPGVSAIQVTLNLLDASCTADVLPLALRLGCGVIARNPRGQGCLTGDYGDISAETYDRDAAEADARARAARQFAFLSNGRRTLAQAAIQYVRQLPAVTVTLPRAVNVSQLEEALGALSAPLLTAEELAQVAAASSATRDLVASHPYREARA